MDTWHYTPEEILNEAKRHRWLAREKLTLVESANLRLEIGAKLSSITVLHPRVTDTSAGLSVVDSMRKFSDCMGCVGLTTRITGYQTAQN